ncbi:MAG: hypothetical protein H7832_06170 [Magnetococcus sp. DMHC-6]
MVKAEIIQELARQKGLSAHRQARLLICRQGRESILRLGKSCGSGNKKLNRQTTS